MVFVSPGSLHGISTRHPAAGPRPVGGLATWHPRRGRDPSADYPRGRYPALAELFRATFTLLRNADYVAVDGGAYEIGILTPTLTGGRPARPELFDEIVVERARS